MDDGNQRLVETVLEVVGPFDRLPGDGANRETEKNINNRDREECFVHGGALVLMSRTLGALRRLVK